ncbi:MAG: putative flippase GtrA [Kiritimatiellia bacterium]|jgi:putative flippase GtrA
MSESRQAPVPDAEASKPSLAALIRHLMSHDAHPFVQFVKYGVAGVLATATFAGVFALVTTYWLPVSEDSRFNYTLASIIAFVPSNVVAYVTNILWVFKPGRHGRGKEVVLFLGASTLAFCIGTPLGQWLVVRFDLVEMLRYLALSVSIVASVLVNYACRKFLIFKG